MNAIAYRNAVLLFTAAYASFWVFNFWTGSPNVFRLFYGKDRSPLEAVGFRFGACAIITIVLMCLTAVWGFDHEKRRALRILTPVWVANLLIALADKHLFDPFWWNMLTLSFVGGIITSYIGGFVLANEKVTIHVHKHIAPDPAVVAEASKTHQA